MSRPFGLALGMACTLFVGSLLSPRTAPADDLSGQWRGTWVSETTGHQGPLRATFTQLDESHYLAQFSGRFFKIFPFRYAVVLNVVADGPTVYLAGEKTLGRRYGTFTYEATATGCHFVADYTSCKDCGRFELHRVCEE